MIEVEGKFVKDEIGEEYKGWKAGDKILITAPTGSGKSSFALTELLKRAIQRDEYILYLVNRVVLKNQLTSLLEDEVRRNMYNFFDDARININNHICIKTYQSLERNIFAGRDNELAQKMKDYAIIIYDECHYFYADANFNTKTVVSYHFLREVFDDRIQIFMSATMENIKAAIKDFRPQINTVENRMKRNPLTPKNGEWKFLEYSVNARYDYINVKMFKTVDDLLTIICDSGKSNEKWIIFTDSIKRGKDMKDKICRDDKNFTEKDVVFIDARYNKDTVAKETVEQISQNQYTDKKIVISTSVMDNGVSIHDEKLRNLVLFCDTKEEFIQMLGRKRKDNQKLNLYICSRDFQHFKQRYDQIKDTLTFFSKHQENLDKISGNAVYFQQDALEAILRGGQQAYRSAKALFYVYRGFLRINYIAVERCRKLEQFYKGMADAIEKDEDVFFREQMSWLNFEEEDIELMLKMYHESDDELHKRKMTEAIEKVLNKVLNKEENIGFKMTIKEQLVYFYKQSNNPEKSSMDAIKKMTALYLLIFLMKL